MSQLEISKTLKLSLSTMHGASYTEADMFSLTSDDFIQFTVSTTDADLNVVDDPQVTWLIKDKSTDISTDMTDYIQQNGYVDAVRGSMK